MYNEDPIIETMFKVAIEINNDACKQAIGSGLFNIKPDYTKLMKKGLSFMIPMLISQYHPEDLYCLTEALHEKEYDIYFLLKEHGYTLFSPCFDSLLGVKESFAWGFTTKNIAQKSVKLFNATKNEIPELVNLILKHDSDYFILDSEFESLNDKKINDDKAKTIVRLFRDHLQFICTNVPNSMTDRLFVELFREKQYEVAINLIENCGVGSVDINIVIEESEPLNIDYVSALKISNLTGVSMERLEQHVT